MTATRAFFLGAGASCADGFPLTSDIVHGLADTMLKDPVTYERPLRFLRTVFRVTDADLHHGAAKWDALKNRKDLDGAAQVLLPDIVELLSLLDVLIADESIVAGHPRQGKNHVRPFSPRELGRVREDISRAVSEAFSSFSRGRKGETTNRFVEALDPADVVVTTNWDLLLDSAMHQHWQATDAHSLGSDVIVVDPFGDPVPSAAPAARSPLYKLHGSLNWLSCSRCTRLYVNPVNYIATLGFRRSAHNDHNECDCGIPLSALLITPTYFKQYRNRHLMNVWFHAQERLALADEWYFIGYSMPTDDVHIRALLLRALHMRLDQGRGAPAITVVTHRQDVAMEVRYRRFFRDVTVDTRGFAGFANAAPPRTPV